MIEELIADIAGRGLLGVLLVIALYGYYRKDCKVTDLQTARLNDMKDVKDQYTDLITEVNSTLDRLIAKVSSSG